MNKDLCLCTATLGHCIHVSVLGTGLTSRFLSRWAVLRCGVRLVLQNQVCPCLLPASALLPVSESSTWSMYTFCIKALIVGFLFQSAVPFFPKEVQSFYWVSWDTFTVSLRQWSSDTINAVLYFWKWACILSFKTLQCAWGEALDDIVYNKKPTQWSKRRIFVVC